MITILLPAVVAFLLTLIAVPFTIRFANKYGLVDNPNKRPHPAHIHKRIIPRAGGLAIYFALVISLLLFLPLEKFLLGIVVGITILLIVGLLDDKLDYFNPYLRLALLFLAASSAVFSGIGISFINNPLYLFNFLSFQTVPAYIRLDYIVFSFQLLGTHSIVVIADIFAFLWIVTLTQIINWSKGVDGQMPGITLISSLILGFLSLKLFIQGDPNQLNVAMLAFILTGTSFGFLIFNWHPAKILPGFSGSTILAFMLAILSILSGAKLATALLVLALPSIDFVFTFFRRILEGHSPVWGDRGHLHHHLLNLGWSHQRISLFYMLISAILGSVALIIDSKSKAFALLFVAVVCFGLILWLNSFGALSKHRVRDNG